MNHEALNKLYNLADTMEEFHQMMGPQFIKVLILVARAGSSGISVSGLESKGNLTKATASRIARLLSDRASATKAGFGIAEWIEDPVDMRIKYLRLKPAGLALVYSMIAAIE